MINVGLKITDSIEEMEDKALRACRLHIDSVFKRAAHAIRRRITEVCEDLIMDTDEYRSLLNGELLGELGVPDIKPRLDHILTTIKNSIEVNSTPININRKSGVVTGGLVFGILRSDFLDILSLPDSSYTTEKGTNIPWLDWLLLQGTRIIVIGYDVKFNLSPAERRRSRTKLALMEKGQGWRVDPEYSGTVNDNFLTRAFVPHQVETLLERIMEDEITSRL